MKKLIVLMANLTVSIGANAIDVYGINQDDSDRIIKKYGKDIAHIELVLQKALVGAKPGDDFSSEVKKLLDKRIHILESIIKENGYLFADFQTIFYPFKNKYYSTIEIIDAEHPNRMRFVSVMPMTPHKEQKFTHQPDLISEMLTYTNMGLQMLMQHKLGSKNISCPVYHCIVGFEHPQLRPYLSVFNKGVIEQKKLILDTLNHDKDPERRTGAAFLVGHFHDPHEIISILSRHLDDKDEGVRNTVMRVIAETMSKSKITSIDVTPFLKALDSPYNTDRNKALLVLSEAANSPLTKNLIIQQGGDKILANFRLEQPNNHDVAYMVLKKLSGKDFGETNEAAWLEWLSSVTPK